jgi:hypothetical protein
LVSFTFQGHFAQDRILGRRLDGPQSRSDVLAKRYIFLPTRDRTPVMQPVPRHVTERAEGENKKIMYMKIMRKK